MTIVIKKGEIMVEWLYLKVSEFKFLCGALNSVINCKEKEIILFDFSMILKNYKYEVHLEAFSEYELNVWKEKLHLIELALPFKCSLPLIPINKIIEVKSQNKKFSKQKCDCGHEADKSHFTFDYSSQKYLCPLCQRQKA